MTVYADTPRWERHGTVWGHLVSDTSLEELHDAARRAGLPGRAFDLDHYDWPAPLRDDLVAAGVRMIGNGELARLLRASGLRIPAARRPELRRARTEAAARALGLDRVPRDLVTGPLGHAEPLPGIAGAFRIGRDRPGDAARIDAHDAAGRAGAARLLAELDRAARAVTGRDWTGQAVDVAGEHVR